MHTIPTSSRDKTHVELVSKKYIFPNNFVMVLFDQSNFENVSLSKKWLLMGKIQKGYLLEKKKIKININICFVFV